MKLKIFRKGKRVNQTVVATILIFMLYPNYICEIAEPQIKKQDKNQ